MTLFRGTLLDTPRDPFTDGSALRAEADGGLLVRDGVIRARGAYADLARAHPGEPSVDLRGGALLPGFVDTHVHFPQVRAIGGLGMPLLDWLQRCALPEEARLAEPAYAEQVAAEFLDGLVRAGTTTALVFGAHFAAAVDILFTRAAQVGLRVTAGQVLSDRALPEVLLTTPERAVAEGAALIRRWHGHGRLRYAVTPRFSLSASEAMLDACAALLQVAPEVRFTTHVNENGAEVDQVAGLFPGRRHYLDTYAHHGLVGERSVLAHNVHPTEQELELLGSSRAWVAHCPTSNAALGSGLFPLRRHLAHRVGVALGSDVGAGTGFSLLKEGLQAYFGQRLLGPVGVDLTPAHLLFLGTRAGAAALGLADQVGDLSVGKQFDACWLRPQPGSTLDAVLPHASDATDTLAKIFALGTPADVAAVWVGGQRIYQASPGHTRHSSDPHPQEAA